jgi:hypothetical protein
MGRAQRLADKVYPILWAWVCDPGWELCELCGTGRIAATVEGARKCVVVNFLTSNRQVKGA